MVPAMAMRRIIWGMMRDRTSSCQKDFTSSALLPSPVPLLLSYKITDTWFNNNNKERGDQHNNLIILQFKEPEPDLIFIRTTGTGNPDRVKLNGFKAQVSRGF
jgi:hypothetical protein